MASPGEGATNARRFSQQLGNETVRIEIGIGLNKKEFLIHKKLLSEKAPVFDKMFNGAFKEAKANYAALPEDDPEAFEAFVEWLYCGTLKTIHFNIPRSEDAQHSEVLRICLFASKYLLAEIADRSLVGYVEHLKRRNVLPKVSIMAGLYRKSPPHSKGRKLVTSLACFAILRFPIIQGQDKLSIASFCDEFMSEKEFMHDVLSEMRLHAGQAYPDPRRTSSPCAYHGHPDAEVCPYKTQPSIAETLQI